jgi:cathepsin B
MKVKVILAITLLTLAACSFRKSHEHEHDHGFITEEYLNEKKTESSFEVYSYEEHPFKGWSLGEIKQLMGLSSLSLRDTKNIAYDLSVNDELPENFDARSQWSNCIHPIRNQGHCGSCWAHAASEVLSDRFCIASNGQVNVALSPQDFVSCDWFDHGCNGGILTTSWLYLRLFGIVSDVCKPYTSGDGKVAWCPLLKNACTAEGQQYKKYHAKNFYALNSIDKIKQNLYTNGPVETGFTVYDDFMNYKSGIYKKGPNASVLGGHAVKIIGWGKEADTEFWVVANSWGESWGEQGYFKIAFGECGIENCIAGDPKLE